MSRRLVRLSLLLLALLCAIDPSGASAQSRTSSAVRGTIRSAGGLPLPDVQVTIRNVQTGTERSVLTNTEGRYLLLQLQPGGPYELRTRVLGYGDQVRSGLLLQVGESLNLDFILQDQAIEVEGVQVEIDRTEIFNPRQVGPATRLSERVVESLPILSRNIMDLAVLSPLVTTTENGGFSIAGRNDRYNSLLIDGVLNQDMFGLTAGGVPGGQGGAKLIPLDAISQYEVLVAPFDVRLSGFTGGVLNAITRTGTNEWRTRLLAVGRTEALIGDLTLPTGPVDASGVDRSLLGVSVGGPIVKDKAHFFFSGEWERRNQPPTGFNAIRDADVLTRVSEGTISQIDQYFGGFGLDVGEAGPFPLSTDLGNLFARVDWTLNNNHRMIIRNVFASAASDASPNREPFDAYEFQSNAARRSSRSNTTSVQLFSDLGQTYANELTVQLQLSSDETTPLSTFPQVEVQAISQVGAGGAVTQRPVRVGGEFFAQENDLNQTVLRLTNALTRVAGDDNFVAGVTGAYYDFENLFLPGAAGDYFFASLNDMQDGVAQRYQRTILQDGVDPAINFRVAELGAFIQNEFDAGGGLTMRFGLRADAPFVLDEPTENPEILEAFGYSTSQVPSGRVLLSPRWGFNWQSSEESRTQLRGGAGLFVGQIPFVWLANAFHNDGLRTTTAICQGRLTDDPGSALAVPAFDPNTRPTGCLRAPFQQLRNVVVFDPEFAYPQDLKFSVAVDHELTEELTLTVGGLINRAINQIVLQELNLGGPAPNLGDLSGYGGLDRRYFGSPVANGLAPNRELPGYEQVLLARNESQDWSTALTFELRGNLTERLAMQAGYTLSRSMDRMSLVATDMISNFGFNPNEFNPNDVQLETSNFDRPHKIVFSVYGAPFPGLDRTEIAVLYTGQSGAPFSYVYRGDINGDGYPGLGPAFDRTNDLIYVPNRSQELPQSPGSAGILAAALENDACLQRFRGEIADRNGCRAPWQNRLDLRIAHAIDLAGAEVRFEGDLINVLNLMNGEWGRIESVRPVVPVIEPVGRQQALPPAVGTLVSRWSGAILPTVGGGTPTDPWSVQTPNSQWQAQFGVRVTFGGAR